ncbi:MAG: PEP-CTERM sorting domain-containing protein [Chthoniobacterales bacterium]|nr:PEP-CTERM sorting domain-containing protein [Chthoniobacterales bacterium]
MKNPPPLHIVLASISVAALAWLPSASAQWTGSSTGDYLNTGNWNGGVINDQFNLAGGGDPYDVNLTGNHTTLGDLNITTVNQNFRLRTPNSTFGTPTVLTLNGNLTFDPGNNNKGIELGNDSSSQPLNINLNGGTRELTVQPGFRDKRSTSQMRGSISNGSLIKLGEGDLEMRTHTANNLSGGDFTILQGRTQLFGMAASAGWAPDNLNLGYSGANGSGGVLIIRNDTNPTPINSSTTALNMNGGSIWFENGTQANALTAGSLNLTGGRNAFIDRHNSQPKAVHFTDFSRSNNGTLMLGGGDNVPVLVGTGGFEMHVTNDAGILASRIGTSTTPGTTNLAILPWAAATSQRDQGAYVPVVRNNPTTGGFLTYDSTGGFRALNLTTEYADISGAASDANAKYSGGGTYSLTGNQTVNSVLFYNNSGDATIALGSNTLTVTSGGIMNVGRTGGDPRANFTGAAGTIAFGANTGYIWAGKNSSADVRIGTGLSGSGGVVIASGNVMFDSNSSNDGLSGPVVVQGSLRVETNAILNANTSLILAGGSGVNYRQDKDGNDWGVFQYTQDINVSSLSGVGRLGDEGIRQFNVGASVAGAANQQVTVGNGAFISPGDPTGGVQEAGQLIFGNNIQGVKFNSGSTLYVGLQSDTQFDKLSLWDETGGKTGFTFDLGSTIVVSLLDGYTIGVGDSWQVFDVIDKQDSIFFSGATVNGVGAGSESWITGTGAAAGYEFDLSNTGVLSVIAVPEPSVVALIGLGLATTLFGVRRNRRA